VVKSVEDVATVLQYWSWLLGCAMMLRIRSERKKQGRRKRLERKERKIGGRQENNMWWQ
jgi:hypothetical protein